jgi:hypothetical protein
MRRARGGGGHRALGGVERSLVLQRLLFPRRARRAQRRALAEHGLEAVRELREREPAGGGGRGR